MNWYLKALKNYANFSGRARRKEYWYFTLFNLIVAVQAAKLENCSFEAGAELEQDRAAVEFEDVGGCGADEIEDPSEKPDRTAPRIVSD